MRLQAKLGLASVLPDDTALTDRLFALMQANRADFTLTFRNLAALSRHDTSGDAAIRDLFIDRPAFDGWAADYRARLGQEARDDAVRSVAMRAVNPKYILRNHLAEQAIRQAQQHDFSELARLQRVLSRPFDEQPEAAAAYGGLPPDWANSLEVSCSS
jgi:serine/tyrosine/threonine adenylyltransferase